MRRTLQEQIAANKRASAVWVALLVILLTALGTAIVGTYAPDYWIAGSVASLVAALLSAVIAAKAGPGIVLSISGARDATAAEDQVLRNVTEEMAIAAGVPMPQVRVIDDGAPNAFATGPDPRHGVVCVTTGLLRKLNRDELQGVVAHEMGHIRNYDIRFMTTVGMIAGMIPLLSDFFLRSLWWGGGRSRKSSNSDSGNLGFVFLAVGLVLAILAPLFAKILELAVSRQREYLADATAAELTRNPEGLANALRKIAADPEPLEAANRATQHLYIVNPLRRLDSIFSTHPPTEERIRRLLGGMGTPIDQGANDGDPLRDWAQRG